MSNKNVFLQGTILLSLLLLLSGCFSFTKKAEIPPKTSAPELYIGVTPNAPPLIYKENGKIVGLEADLGKALGEYLGLPVRFVELDWEDQIPALEDGKVDIIMSGMSITKARSFRISFCDSYFRAGQMMLVDIANAKQFPRGYYDLKWKKNIKIGVVSSTTGDYFARENLPKSDLSHYKDSESAVSALIRGRIDAFIYDAPMIAYAAAMHETKGVVPVYNLLTEEYLAWGVAKNSTALHRQADAFLAESKENGKIDSLLRKWIPYLN